jgi:type I restriction enzyme S subunit
LRQNFSALPLKSLVGRTFINHASVLIASEVSCIGRGVCAIRAKEGINQELLNIYIASMRRLIYNLGTGSTFPNVSISQLSEIQFAIPPATQQGCIKEKLYCLSDKAKILESIYQHKRDDLEELKKSILQKAFNGEL